MTVIVTDNTTNIIVSPVITTVVDGGDSTNVVVEQQTTEIISAPNVTEIVIGEAVSGLAETFESVSKNLKAYPVALTYDNGILSSLAYTTPSGTITKTLGFVGGILTTVTLSGATPSGIALVKEFTYTDGAVSSINYS